MFVRRFVPVMLSALVPGLGQLARGRVRDALLALAAALYLHWILAGCACQAGASSWTLGAFIVGPAGFPGGFTMPVAVVIALVALGVHALAAWDARAPTALRDRGAAPMERSAERG